MQNGAVVELVDVVKRYGRVAALDHVSLALEKGRVTALLGPNGAGKTTAVKLMIGLSRPNRGRARLFGLNPLRAKARRRCGVMLQIARVPDTLKVREHVHLFSSYYRSPMKIPEALALAGLADVAERKYGELSGGQKQRLQFALAVCGNPDVLMLDEPTVGMDVETRRSFWQTVRGLTAKGRTVLLTTHYLEEADALADRIVVLNAGRIVADGPPHVIKAKVAGRRVRCVTSLSEEALKALPAVQSMRREGAAVEFLTQDAEGLVRALLARDETLAGLEVTGAGLEEAFIELTRGSPSRAGAVEAVA